MGLNCFINCLKKKITSDCIAGYKTVLKYLIPIIVPMNIDFHVAQSQTGTQYFYLFMNKKL